VAVFAGGSAAIKKAHIAKATSDLHNFQIAVEMTLNESPQVANIATETKKAQLESIMDALNGNLAADYKLTAVDGTLTGNITKTAATTDDTSFIICRSDKTDSWGNPYFVIIDRAERGGSSASEFYMTAVSAGPNAILHLDGAIDVDDVFLLTSYADGDVISATYNMAEAAPTIVGGSEAATTYTSAMTAPVNNGVTVGGYVAPETPAQDPQQGGGNEPAAKQTPTAPTLSATSGSVTVGNTTSFTVSRQGTGAVSAVSANESVATVSVSGTTVTVTGVAAGTTTISVSAAEDASYTASGSVSYTVTVAPVSNPFASATVGQIVSAGTMYANGTALEMPRDPAWSGDLYSWKTSSVENNIKDYYNAIITFGDTVSGKELNWVKVSDALFICDRNLWNYISWDDINGMGYMTGTTVTIDGQTFTLRCLTSDEWDTYVSSHTTNGDPFYWRNCYSWTQTASGSFRVLRGNLSASFSRNNVPSYRDNNLGFRPVLELVG